MSFRGYKDEATYLIVEWFDAEESRSAWLWNSVQLCGHEAEKDGEPATVGRYRLAEEMVRYFVLENDRTKDRTYNIATVDWLKIAEEYIHGCYGQAFSWGGPRC